MSSGAPPLVASFLFFFFNDTATTEIYTLSLHDALPISGVQELLDRFHITAADIPVILTCGEVRSEEHTSELQSRLHLVCRLLLEKKKRKSRTQRNPSHDRRDTIGGAHGSTA